MLTLEAQIEALLFVTAQAMTVRRLSEACNVSVEEIETALDRLASRLADEGSGLQLARQPKEVELVTRPEAADLIRQALKLEMQGELTKPSLETLAILAYRGPLTRPEIEQIRGVQSSLILRNLALRGLVEVKEDTRLGQPIYSVTLDFLKHLGLEKLEALPNFEELHASQTVEKVLDELKPMDGLEASDDKAAKLVT